MKGKIYSVFVKSNNPQFIIKGAKEMLFYDANNPKRNVLKNSLATEITLVENNQFKSPRFAQVLPLLILPFIGVLMVLMVIFL